VEGRAPAGDFAHATDLVGFLADQGFEVLAACYPERHPEATSMDADLAHLKEKVDAGASHLISQLFLDNASFYQFLARARSAGITVPIEAGIMPVVNERQIRRMVRLCDAELPEKFRTMMDRYGSDDVAMRDAGIAYAVNQIVDLVSHGVDGVHLYTMNDPEVARRITEATASLFGHERTAPDIVAA
jgi:methylenetetrahydrofolate reductase (NADPH)